MSQSPWEDLLPDIGNDSIVCLGEEAHWVETYLEVKGEVIPLLHQEKDFNVVIFESGFIQSYMALRFNLRDGIRQQTTLYDLWQTPSTLELIRYMDSQKSSDKPIQQFGCDLKGPKSFLFAHYLKVLIGLSLNSAYANEVHELDSNFVEMRFRWEPEIGKANKGVYLTQEIFDDYLNEYQKLKKYLNDNKELWVEENKMTNLEFDFLLRCVDNRVYLLELMQLPTYQLKHQFRDSIMAENVSWLINEFIPNGKYIIWGADIHISKNAKWEQMGKEWESNLSLVEHLMKKMNQSIFSIGIKPIKSLDRKMRKTLRSKPDIFYLNNNDVLPITDEHDALIICKEIEKIE